MRPGDPETQFGAAARMGKLVAQGLLEPAEALDSLCAAAFARAHPAADRSGLRARLSWEMHDSADAWQSARHGAEMQIRRALQPLLNQRADATSIVRHAQALNERLQGPLLRPEVLAIVGEEMHAALRFMRPVKGRRRVG
jgi:hypothetical protein